MLTVDISKKGDVDDILSYFDKGDSSLPDRPHQRFPRLPLLVGPVLLAASTQRGNGLARGYFQGGDEVVPVTVIKV